MKTLFTQFFLVAPLFTAILGAQSRRDFAPPLSTNADQRTTTVPSPNDAAPIPAGLIQHVIVIVQENRTPDNLFHGLPNADIADSGVDSKGKTILLKPTTLANKYDLSHSHAGFLRMYDDGKMDGADKIEVFCNKGAKHCPPRHPQFMYVEPAEVRPYFRLAQQYTFADRMFQTNQGPSFPAHQFIISGTSAPTATSDLFSSENPRGVKHALRNTGCTAPPWEFVWLLDPRGHKSQKTYPCFEHPTLPDLLDNAGIRWRYYAPSAGSIWTGPNAIAHLRFGPDWSRDVILNQKQVLRDVAQGKLADVSWVIPSGQQSDHAGINDGRGPSWVASIVNYVGKSRYWSSTAMFITWDDWGGWYDHVAPYIYDSYEYGFRVPLIVVSPYAKAGYVSHVTHDFGSILKFVEKVYDLPSLGYADARADDLLDCFNFKQTPQTFRVIPAPYDANYFLNDKRPPSDPDDD
jgi:phospholipase C